MKARPRRWIVGQAVMCACPTMNGGIARMGSVVAGGKGTPTVEIRGGGSKHLCGTAKPIPRPTGRPTRGEVRAITAHVAAELAASFEARREEKRLTIRQAVEEAIRQWVSPRDL